MQLVLVESPTKSKTISKFLGSKYKVLSSYGHIRDLPEKRLGINIENNFQPEYIIVPKAKKVIQSIKKEAEKSEKVILATDEDREGEAIAWHLIKVLDLENKKPYERITFHEITKNAIIEAIKNPRKININLVNSQQTRRILDRLVGYKLSPFLWKKVFKGLSAGRVQSVAVRLIVEREREIEKFIPQEYWTIEALLESSLLEKKQFIATLVKKDNKPIEKFEIKTQKEAEKIVEDLKGAEYIVESIERKETKKHPLPPFTTSTLQQSAWNNFKWPAKLTMNIAQQLYEKGFTTYHRTDSVNISNISLLAAKKFIIENYGEKYHQLRKYKTKSKSAQEAHEAIRPTYIDKTVDKVSNNLDQKQLKLYKLIWERFISSQMSSAVIETKIVNIKAKNYIFKSTGQTILFDGFTKVYKVNFSENLLPKLKENESLKLVKINPNQHFTQPPPRYTEATLIKKLEENGIGRPSTYAPILSTIQERNYVEKDEQKRLKPTEIGILVNDILVKHFPEIVDISFTAKMEDNLDKVASGKKDWIEVVKEFYYPFEKTLQEKYKEVSKKEFTEKATEKKCPKCNSQLIIKMGKFGKFYACSLFPKCKYTEAIKQNETNLLCPKCKNGEVIKKITKKKKIFYGCSNWPKCDFASWDKPTNQICPECSSFMIEKRNKIICSNKNCQSLKNK